MCPFVALSKATYAEHSHIVLSVVIKKRSSCVPLYSYLLFYICLSGRSYVAALKAEIAENVHFVLSSPD